MRPSMWGRSLLGYVAFTLALLTVMPAAFAEQRVALVIGNGDYAKVGELPNPTRDAAAGTSDVEAERSHH